MILTRQTADHTSQSDMTDSIEQSIYDYPVYYDLLFGSDWKAEFAFSNTASSITPIE